jgi:hypothetical protein
MQQTRQCLEQGVVERVFRLVLDSGGDELAEQCIRDVIVRKRGDLRAFHYGPPRRPHSILLYLGGRRLDDVLAALEGAGFDVAALVVTQEPASVAGTAGAPAAADSSARSLNL